MSTAVKRLQDLIGLRVTYNYKDSSLKVTLLENSGGDKKIFDFLLLFQTDLKNCSQEINNKKDVQFHGVVINNRLFNLIHFSSREEVFVVLV